LKLRAENPDDAKEQLAEKIEELKTVAEMMIPEAGNVFGMIDI